MLSGQSSTAWGAVIFLVLILIYDAWRLKTGRGTGRALTLSDLFWTITRTGIARAALLVGMILGFFGGHLIWQSQRTYTAIECESRGGYMKCLEPKR